MRLLQSPNFTPLASELRKTDFIGQIKWMNFFDGQIWLAESGIDFDIPTFRFVARLKYAAKYNGIYLEWQVHKPDVLFIGRKQ